MSQIVTLDAGIDYLASYEAKMNRVRKLVKGLLLGTMNAIVISGEPGIGKTWTITDEIRKYEEELGIQSQLTRGHITPLELYEKMASYSTRECVLIFDDADSVFTNMQALNILKAAAETMPTRRITWDSPRASVREFFFEGKIIILTNVALHRSVHHKAMTDRFHVYDPEINLKEKLHKIKDVALKMQGLPPEVGQRVVDFLFDKEEYLVSLTLRTFVKAAELAQSLPDDWQELAEYTVLKQMAEA